MSRQLRIRRLAHAADLPLPRYETAGAAGMERDVGNGSDGKKRAAREKIHADAP